ncbi:hypothetical protein [Alcanivorax sp. S71-1-4]|uniref:hypothetical protein n=1 Tax=Alcanivorax sp. S71-1-4 TaxID=1177159 RepID=UPI00135C774E|nr:hypothetical protein [Alcanivorax sp. S71-1-4]
MNRSTRYSLMIAGLLSLSTFAYGDGPGAPDAPKERAALVSVDGDMAVTVSTGNEVLDETANLLMRCTERNAALEACGGGLRGMACRKALEVGRYKNLECPEM